MAARILIRKRQDRLSHFLSAISSAFSELSLIIILFIGALLSYFAVRFARYCELRAPCLLCSRLDRFLESSNIGFYKELFCDAHKSDISSLALCSSHHRLADAREMCDDCVISFFDTMELDDGLNGDLLRKRTCGEDMKEHGSLPLRRCTCCSRPFRNRPLASIFLMQKPISAVAVEPTFPLSMAKRMDNSPSSLTIYRGGNRDRSSHVGYSEVKITSADDDDASMLAHATDNLKEKLLSRDVQVEPMTIVQRNLTQGIADDMIPEKLPNPSSLVPEHSLMTVERKLKVEASHSTAGIGLRLEEVNRSQVDVSPNARVLFEITTEQVPLEGLNTKLHAQETEVAYGEATKALGSTDISLKMSQLMNEKLSPRIMCRLPSVASTESITGRESSRVSEDLKVRFSQGRPEFPWNDMSPSARSNGQGDEHRLCDALNSTGLPNHAKRYYVDRFESGLESVDGGVVSEIEGECTIEQLKNQIEMYRKSMSILYKELEEERNASAIAANQAMAMINRLQEEKASMQMEALQYLRLMEEQTEYDQEALQKLNELLIDRHKEIQDLEEQAEYDQEALQNLSDLLVDRDKEIQDLEAEIDSYRKQFGGGPLTSSVLEPLVNCEEREYMEYTPTSKPRFNELGGYETGLALVNNTTLEFDDEKLYISECLKSLEEASIIF